MSAIQLWTKHRRLARLIASEYFIPGSETEDVEQEAEIALWIAARTYKPGEAGFTTFATLVVKRHLFSCIKASKRKKQIPLTESVRTLSNNEGDVDSIVEMLPCLHQVADVVEENEYLAALVEEIGKLDEFERHCVLSIASGKSYAEIGPSKMVDNTLFRARGKLRKAMEARA